MIKASHATLEQNLAGAAAATTPEAPRKARGADADRREAILDAADAVFLEQGFQAASMSAIAARVGGSKGTLYNYFPSKEELFLACVSRHCESLQSQMSALATRSEDVRTALTQLGRHYVSVVSSDDVVRKFRMIVAEAERVPELARAFYETGPARGRAMLADYLQGAMQKGELIEADPLQAANHFLGLCNNRLSKARLCAVESAPDDATIDRDVGDAVRIFMAAYGAK
ncbi:MAG TPA: TetR/AcrR family transcriptional regulator [Caulobacterales bacterium]|nr:TetR/AcrR family transcriptional regulator [Caulobacterales bacterium]